MKISIKHRRTNKIIYESKAETLREVVQEAVGQGAYLRGAYLRGADLQGADLQGAYLQGADLQGADLQGADLQGADLQGADLQGADLQGAKGYGDSHDFFFEIVRRVRIETITKEEWSIIGQLSIHRWCWDTIKQQFGDSLFGLLKKIADAGFDEYLKGYKQLFPHEDKAEVNRG